ncbi:hypothetical protein BWI97_01385 [Siphonobacter sp. BAB-5405]|uniref:HU domain-containing protein n=1 Tax=Siphonobacter sp. BAB-5405 TaxID=1864825 RepID=UPI000C7FC3C3|nr:SPOR domain-containing protein [Siphonobacter sp. BAB-5405]PMD99091.1 hypothetical protein BWI97_01385 [Siphonobacter sp. BAB-5405]
MATIPEHVKKLLFEQDCVVIPEFGGFIGNFDSATFLPSGSVLPPRKRLVFNEMLQFDDGLLTNYVATVENRSREEVKVKVRAFVDQVRSQIRQQQQYQFDQLGVFTQNVEGKLVFEPAGKINFHGESFGLGEFTPAYKRTAKAAVTPSTAPAILEPEVEELPAPLPVSTTPVKRLSRWAAAAVVIMAVTLVGAWMTGQHKTTLSSMNPVSALDFSWLNAKKAESVAVVLPKQPAQPIAVAQPVVKPQPVVAAPVAEEEVKVAKKNTMKFLVVPSRVKTLEGAEVAKGYYIVAGSFGGVKSATVMKKQLEGDGFRVQMFRPRKGLVKVVVGDQLPTAAAAQEKARNIGNHFHNNLWILKSLAD